MVFRLSFQSLLVLLMLLVSGCMDLSDPFDTQRKAFESDNIDFMQRLRWQDIGGAAEHFAAPRREDFRDRFRDEPDLKITDVRLKSAEFSEDGEQVDSVIELEYYRLPSTRVRTHRYALHWTFFGPEQPTPAGWQITSDFPPIP